MNYIVPRITKINLVLDFDETLVHLTRNPLKRSKLKQSVLAIYTSEELEKHL